MKKNGATTPAKGVRRGYWFLAVLGTILVTICAGIILGNVRAIVLKRFGLELEMQAEENARIIGEHRLSMQNKMIALAEQRGLRQGMMAWMAGSTSKSWQEGFFQAVDAASRATIAGEKGLRNFTLRDLNGRRLAGTGPEVDMIDYPDIMRRIQRHVPSGEDPKDYIEKWVVPVRDTDAQPMAFIVAEFNPLGSQRILKRSIIMREDDLFCLEDSSGVRLFNSNESSNIPVQNLVDDQFRLQNQTYKLAKAQVPELNWLFVQARPWNSAQLGLVKIRRIGVLFIILSALILCTASFLFIRMSRH